MIAILLFTIGAITLVAAIIGLAINDIRTFRMQKAINKHPGARKWRQRPVVLLDRNTVHLKEIRKSYRKITTIDTSSDTYLTLNIGDDILLTQSAIINAVQRFNHDESLSVVALLPIIQKPQTSRQLLHAYKIIACTPFRILRSELGVASDFTLLRPNPPSHYSFVYTISSHVIKLFNFTTLLYALYAALILIQPELLLTYAVALSFWLIWTICRYPHLSLDQKIFYLLLSPASFGFFTFTALTAPFKIGARQVRIQNAMMK